MADIRSKFLITMEGSDRDCFKWCVLRSLNPIKKNGCRISSSLREKWEKYNWNGIHPPYNTDRFEKFESNNKDIALFVLEWDDKDRVVRDVYRSEREDYDKKVYLLSIGKRFRIINNIGGFISRCAVIGSGRRRENLRWPCLKCYEVFTRESTLKKHDSRRHYVCNCSRPC